MEGADGYDGREGGTDGGTADRSLPTAQGVAARGDSARSFAFANTLTHWWDGSQIYGTDKKQLEDVRGDNGRLLLGEVPIQIPKLVEDGTSEPGFWLGLGMMEILFSREHNSICDMLAEKKPELNADERFQTARLINTALLAKIHTTEWTPMVTANPAAAYGVRANWYGLAGKRIHRLRNQLRGRGPFGPHAFSSPTLFGIPGSRRNDHGVPFALTEEFSAVYRMHQLVPDAFNFRSARDNSETLGNTEFGALTGQLGRDVLKENDLADLLYTFGTTNPGLVTLHNFPQGLRTLKRIVDKNGDPREIEVDLATIDILRCRELGVPRYTEFRRLLGLKVPQTFEEVTSNSTWADELAAVYDGKLDSVDLLTGMYAEDLLEGFAFSETAFRIFILMASRRISCDRFLTDDYTAECYTHEGLAWIDDTTMLDVLQRHCPTLRPHLSKVKNAFMSWNPDANSH